MNDIGRTTKWKERTDQRSINFCIHYALLYELDSLKQTTGSSRSEMIRSAIRSYIRQRTSQFTTLEQRELESYVTRSNIVTRRDKCAPAPEHWVEVRD